ncbi:squalene/phytoene synthase family protein [Nonomuraea sp. NPDC005650]|uniref:phytoene/squalene synthase family protein n=1 Tax=Nonomuraea sp. NPDC005650 TaxID=3157045 RepID=UPI0033BC494E
MTIGRARDLTAAYAYCERTTWQHARNFAYGIRLLPSRKRQAMCAIYAMARRIDDIADGPLPPTRKLAQLEHIRAQMGRLETEDEQVLLALADAADSFSLPLDAFADLIDGVEMDVRGTRYETWPELALYCRCVAGSIGRLSVAVFGARDRPLADYLGDTLGVGLQLTNVVRDIREDALMHRLYLPTQEVARFGCEGHPPVATAAFADLVRFQSDRAHALIDEGLRLLPMLGYREAACVSAMTGIYRALLRRITRDPFAVLERRASLPTTAKAGVAVRALLGPARTIPCRREAP